MLWEQHLYAAKTKNADDKQWTNKVTRYKNWTIQEINTDIKNNINCISSKRSSANVEKKKAP